MDVFGPHFNAPIANAFDHFLGAGNFPARPRKSISRSANVQRYSDDGSTVSAMPSHDGSGSCGSEASGAAAHAGVHLALPPEPTIWGR